jgi:hypothetical protein
VRLKAVVSIMKGMNEVKWQIKRTQKLESFIEVAIEMGWVLRYLWFTLSLIYRRIRILKKSE